MTHKNLSIIYEGKAMADHSIDIKDLAPSLLSFSDLIETSYISLGGNQKDLSIRVTANKEGSFEVLLSLGINMYELFKSDKTQAFQSMLQAIGFATGVDSLPGLIDLLRKSKGKNPKKVTTSDNSTTLIFDHCTIEVSNPTFNLYKNINVRKKVEETFSVVNKEGMDSLGIKDENGKLIEKIGKKEFSFLETPKDIQVEEKILNETISKEYVSIVNLALKEDNKWRFSSGGEKPFFALVSDEVFLNKVDTNKISFRKDDLFFVKIKRTQLQTSNGLREEIEVLEILEQREASIQLSFNED